MTQRQVNTPGAVGYVLVLVISAIVMPPLYLVPANMAADGLDGSDVNGFVSL